MRTFSNPEEKRQYLTQEPIPRLILTMALPAIVSMLISSFYNMADTFFISLTGSDAMMIFRMTHQETAASKLAEKGAALVSESELDRL